MFIAVAMPWLIAAPFHGDDYVFLDRVTRPTFHFADIWNRETTTFGWYRPWSRELHFWALSRVFGLNEAAFHVANGVLWTLMLGLYALFVRRLAGSMIAWFAMIGALAAAIWLVPLFWASGSQDLWMLTFLMAALLAWTCGRSVLTALLLTPALLSKENAIVAPVLLAGYSFIIERRAPWKVVRALVPTLFVLSIWFVVHPTIIAHILQRYAPDPAVVAARQSWPHLTTLSLLVPFNAEHVSADMLARWFRFDAHAIGGLGLLTVAAWCWHHLVRSQRSAAGESRAGAIAQIVFGCLWWLCGCVPVFVGSVAWHSYYAALGVLGAWIGMAGVARWRPSLAFSVLVLAICARGPRLSTPDWDWGAFPAQERAGQFVRELRVALLHELPNVPSYSRLFFTNVPRGIGFVTADGPLVRILYRDTTLRAGFWGQYRPRHPQEIQGTDYFISFVPPRRWHVVRPDGAPPATNEAVKVWETDHRELALLLGRAGDWVGAASELETLLRFRPYSAEYRRNYDYCLRRLEDANREEHEGASGWHWNSK